MPNDILLVGLPRSGTSWAGSVLGRSPSLEYLREPITQAWLEAGNRTPIVDPNKDEAYRHLAESNLAGAGSRRLIKEVNPLLVAYVLDELQLQVVLLQRHPCAVALSYHERGWTRVNVTDRFGVATSGDFWRDHGAYQALLLSPAVAVLEGRGSMVWYEDLAGSPEAAFARLAGELGLEWNEDSATFLRSTLVDDHRSDPYAVTRDAVEIRDRWRSVMGAEQQQAVLAGFNQYRSDCMELPEQRPM